MILRLAEMYPFDFDDTNKKRLKTELMIYIDNLKGDTRMKYVKSDLRNRIGDENLSDSCICYIEKDLLWNVYLDDVMNLRLKIQVLVEKFQQQLRFYCEKERMMKCRILVNDLQSTRYFQGLHSRHFMNNGPDTVEELLDRHVIKKKRTYDDNEDENLTTQRLTSTRHRLVELDSIEDIHEVAGEAGMRLQP
ncbi:hypothetical protein E3N88_11733 [Mikania micrantha]|uniref:Uncharacterized protein n=1 Tax=Mikania micrantha TaxID=192012 RepID=A0A5N6P3I8_9ASTR|nr:hypothetical protein E3N88_11733 [Mikania micrantha]